MKEKELSSHLFYKSGSSDKEYQASLEKKDKGFVVNFKYGRRGNAGNAGSKTIEPVTYDEALEIYHALVRSKTSKGYVEDIKGVPFQ